jgi:hypothetical protein
MSPLDDELRRAMHRRADHLAPAPDPLAGIETRARRMKRRQVSTAIAGAALAVAAIAAAVPVLTSGSGRSTVQVAASTAPPTPSATALPTEADPINLLAWPARGSAAPPADVDAVKKGFADALGGTEEQARFRLLFSTTQSGLTVTVGQAWLAGQIAYEVSYATGGANGPELFVGGKISMQTPILTFVAAGAAGSTKDLLVLVPAPYVGQVSYSPDATTTFSPVSAPDGVGFVQRDPRAMQDRIEVLDGDGNLDKPLYRGGLGLLLCGYKECG